MVDTLPLIVTGSDGSLLSVSRMNRKAYEKSLERGELWHVHEETGRVLPLDIPGSMVSLLGGETWFHALLSASVSTEGGKGAEESSGAVSGGSASGVIEELSAVIARRRESMPEGSYTTHLFSSGTGKIKKKLGEEAVELILAESREEITYEAADLIYHLLVFLEDAGIPFREVLDELASRR